MVIEKYYCLFKSELGENVRTDGQLFSNEGNQLSE
jgi:hypothetical protein